MDMIEMQRFYSPRHDLINFVLRREEGFYSLLYAHHDKKNSFLGNFLFLVFFLDFSYHCSWKSFGRVFGSILE